jgi:hypothetical protein
MGYLVYDGHTRITFDDRVLAHIEVVIVNKLRREGVVRHKLARVCGER